MAPTRRSSQPALHDAPRVAQLIPSCHLENSTLIMWEITHWEGLNSAARRAAFDASDCSPQKDRFETLTTVLATLPCCSYIRATTGEFST